MVQQTILITGASDGIGAAAAKQLLTLGEKVVIVGRSATKTQAVGRALGVDYFVTDFTDLSQVRELAAALLHKYPRIDVLANNAGGIMGKREITKDGFEKSFQVNHLAPFLLTHLLMPTLIASKAKVIQTSSMAAQMLGKLDINDLQFEKSYSSQMAYGTVKLENILFTRELDRRYRAKGISAVAFHPGVVGTNFASEGKKTWQMMYHTPLIKNLFTISPAKGAARLVFLASGTPGVTWQPGEYYQKNILKKSSAQSHDMDLAKQLWDKCAALLGL